MQKKELRRRIIECRDRLTPTEITAKSILIAGQLYGLPAYEKAERIMFFVSFGSEVATRSMVEESIYHGKTVLVPKAVPKTRELIPSRLFNWHDDLAPGFYGIPEPHQAALRPQSPSTIDLLIVPGVAFDLKGNRLGYGGGYYDRFFPLLREDVPLVALVFDCQIRNEVPVDEWDRRVDYIITEKRIIDASSSWPS